MLDSLRIKNFRSIKDSKDLKLSNLNIFVGPNNAGKSSILYSILLLKQTLEDKDQRAVLVTSSPHLDLGSYIDIINANDPEKSLEINLEFNKSLFQKAPYLEAIKPLDDLLKRCNKYKITFKFSKEKNIIFVSSFNISNSKTKEFYGGEYVNEKWILSGFPKEILPHITVRFGHFLPIFRPFGKKPADEKIVNKILGLLFTGGALLSTLAIFSERILYVGPVRQLIPRYGFLGRQYYSELSPYGENLMKVLISSKLRRRAKKTILEELNFWLDKKFNLLKNIQIEEVDKGKTVISIIADDPKGEKNINLASMGSGISQLVPVIVQTILTPKKGCIVIEQPEIHLHPAAQAALGELFIKYAKNDKQLIVETHSEHLLLRIRRRIAEGKISPDLVSIFFVDKRKNETRIRKLDLQKDGHFKKWPTGFFEEGYHEAMALAVAQLEEKKK